MNDFQSKELNRSHTTIITLLNRKEIEKAQFSYELSKTETETVINLEREGQLCLCF